MRALLRKEYQQSRLLPWTGLIMSVAMIVLYALWVARYSQTAKDQDDLNAFYAGVLVVAGYVMLIAATTGAISSETGGGTLAYLLGLPLPRTRIWWAKALAAAGLAVVAWLLLVLPVALVLPGVPRSVSLWVYLPDLLACALLVFAVTLFWSTLLARTLTVLLAAPATLALALLGIVWAVDEGIELLRYDGVIDASLWAALLTAPFLLASWAAFRHGELLDSPRKWLLALTTLAGATACVVLLMLGGARWEQRYRRGDVQRIGWASLPPGGEVAAVDVQGSRARFARDANGWRGGRVGPLRSSNTVLVDLRTGREVAWWPGEKQAVVSPDGRFVVLPFVQQDMSLPPGFTEVWQTKPRRLLHREQLGVVPWRFGELQEGADIAWSGRGDWLALREQEDLPQNRGFRQTLVTMQPDGSRRRELRLVEMQPEPPAPKGLEEGGRLVIKHLGDSFQAWTWASGSDMIYLLSMGGEVLRYSPADGSRAVLARLPNVTARPQEWMGSMHRIAVSADGRRLAARMPVVAPSEQHAGRSRTWVLSLAGSHATVQHQFEDGTITSAPLYWSPDATTLFVGTALRWHEGDEGLTPLHLPKEVDLRNVAALPFGHGLLVSDQRSGQQYFVDEEGRVRSAWGEAATRAADRIVGVAADGRLVVVQRWPAALALLDRDANRPRRIYP
jgi:ABC-type transport system involved in multi-copper enzyme maturation permease subunit